MLVQAPVFHAHTFSIYVELESPATLEEFRGGACRRAHRVRSASSRASPATSTPPANKMFRSPPGAMRRSETGFWVWAAADNLRIGFARGGVRRRHGGHASAGEGAVRPGVAKAIARALLVLLACSGCGYHAAGKASHLPENVRTIAVPAFREQDADLSHRDEAYRRCRPRIQYANQVSHRQQSGGCGCRPAGHGGQHPDRAAYLRLANRTRLRRRRHHAHESRAHRQQRQCAVPESELPLPRPVPDLRAGSPAFSRKKTRPLTACARLCAHSREQRPGGFLKTFAPIERFVADVRRAS